MAPTLDDLFDELPRRLGRPQRPHLDAARAAVAACSRGRLSALEALASRGLLPPEWVGDPSRRFRTGARAIEPLKSTHAVALAADLEGVVTAEELAREYIRRLRYFGGPTRVPGVTLWTFRTLQLYARSRRTESAFFGRRYAQLGEPLLTALGWDDPVAASLPRGRSVVRRCSLGGWSIEETSVLHEDIRQYGRLATARVRGLSLTTPVVADRWWTLPAPLVHRVERRPFAALPDPFEPLLALWRLGYALGNFDAQQCELVAPPCPLEATPVRPSSGGM